eukprot:TRINITY_DN627_c0_g1_i2.p1 TRINITY_DN627_c0_g1~~TRINITY_DN627_c0_g1_i2.p1  ORF type:complete len:504 (+),score=69.71 TRINITY_DN627_c0_g1_i2:1016-2527(+)
MSGFFSLGGDCQSRYVLAQAILGEEFERIKRDMPTLAVMVKGASSEDLCEAGRDCTPRWRINQNPMMHSSLPHRPVLYLPSLTPPKGATFPRFRGLIGCPHCERVSAIYCEKCKSFFACGLCHYDHGKRKDHLLFDSGSNSSLLCCLCGTVQDRASHCVTCGSPLHASYHMDAVQQEYMSAIRQEKFDKVRVMNDYQKLIADAGTSSVKKEAIVKHPSVVSGCAIHPATDKMGKMSVDKSIPTRGGSESVPLAKPGVFGCPHYQRGCLSMCHVCKSFHMCRLCHGEKVCGHAMDRFRVELIQCLYCGETQEVSERCVNCRARFGTYFCPDCRLFTEPDKSLKIFHCDKCGQCRQIGKDVEVMHCDQCGVCVNKHDHVCFKHNIREGSCSVCHEPVFYSRKNFFPSPCGHFIHEDCLKTLVNTCLMDGEIPKCPICRKCVVKIQRIDERIKKFLQEEDFLEKFPEYKDKTVWIHCNECGKDAEVPYHHAYFECPHCHHFNTQRK